MVAPGEDDLVPRRVSRAIPVDSVSSSILHHNFQLPDGGLILLIGGLHPEPHDLAFILRHWVIMPLVLIVVIVRSNVDLTVVGF